MSNQIQELFIEITNQCQQKCIHCSSSANDTDYESLSLDDIKRVINETIHLGLKRVTLSGGEPLLHPNIINIIEFLRDTHIKFNIYSCGVKDNEPIPLSLLQYVKDCGINRMIFSIHAASPELQEEITGYKDSLICVMHSIKLAKNIDIDVEVHFVLMRKNKDELDEVIKLSKDLGVNRLSILRLVNQGRCINDLELSGSECTKILAKVKPSYYMPIRLGTPFNCITHSGSKCTAGDNKLLISASGEVFPCESFKWLKGNCFNMNIKDDSIKDIWDNSILLKSIRTAKESRITICSTCKDFKSCHGGCMGQRLKAYNDLSRGPDPLCKDRRMI